MDLTMISGWKTYLGGLGMILSGLALMLSGEIAEGAGLVSMGLGAIGIRHKQGRDTAPKATFSPAKPPGRLPG